MTFDDTYHIFHHGALRSEVLLARHPSSQVSMRTAACFLLYNSANVVCGSRSLIECRRLYHFTVLIPIAPCEYDKLSNMCSKYTRY